MTESRKDRLDELVQRHPALFDGGRPARSELPTGWFGIVDEACEQWMAQESPAANAGAITRQIKSKWGTLRWYVEPDSVSPAVESIIERACALSATTCMVCGRPGRTRWPRPVHTVCDDHTG